MPNYPIYYVGGNTDSGAGPGDLGWTPATGDIPYDYTVTGTIPAAVLPGDWLTFIAFMGLTYTHTNALAVTFNPACANGETTAAITITGWGTGGGASTTRDADVPLEGTVSSRMWAREAVAGDAGSTVTWNPTGNVTETLGAPEHWASFCFALRKANFGSSNGYRRTPNGGTNTNSTDLTVGFVATTGCVEDYHVSYYHASYTAVSITPHAELTELVALSSASFYASVCGARDGDTTVDTFPGTSGATCNGAGQSWTRRAQCNTDPIPCQFYIYT